MIAPGMWPHDGPWRKGRSMLLLLLFFFESARRPIVK